LLIDVTDYWVREGLARWIQFVTANNEILPLYYFSITYFEKGVISITIGD